MRANRIHEVAALLPIPSFVAEYVASLLKSLMVQRNGTKRLPATSSFNRAAQQAPRLWLFSKVINHLHERNETNETITNADAANLLFS